MENKAFTDFENLLSEIDDFKKNVQNSNKLLDTLNDLVAKIEACKQSLDDRYNGFLVEIKTTNETLSRQTESIVSFMNDISNSNRTQQQFLLEEIKKLKSRMIYLYGGLGITIILGALAIFIK